jgi:transposase
MESKPALKTRSMQVMEARLGEPLDVVIARLYHEQGMTLAQVAERLGVTIGTVSRWMTALGLEARFPGQRGKPVEAVA